MLQSASVGGTKKAPLIVLTAAAFGFVHFGARDPLQSSRWPNLLRIPRLVSWIAKFRQRPVQAGGDHLAVHLRVTSRPGRRTPATFSLAIRIASSGSASAGSSSSSADADHLLKDGIARHRVAVDSDRSCSYRGRCAPSRPRWRPQGRVSRLSRVCRSAGAGSRLRSGRTRRLATSSSACAR